MKYIAFLLVLLAASPVLAAAKQLPDGTVINANDMRCIEHAVVDADAWVDHAYATVGMRAINEKIEEWCPKYDADKAEKGEAYMNRAARDAARE